MNGDDRIGIQTSSNQRRDARHASRCRYNTIKAFRPTFWLEKSSFCRGFQVGEGSGYLNGGGESVCLETARGALGSSRCRWISLCICHRYSISSFFLYTCMESVEWGFRGSYKFNTKFVLLRVWPCMLRLTVCKDCGSESGSTIEGKRFDRWDIYIYRWNLDKSHFEGSMISNLLSLRKFIWLNMENNKWKWSLCWWISFKELIILLIL